MLAATGQHKGYALWFGVDDGQLLQAVAAASQLHIVAIDSDEDRIQQLRRELDQAGLYGRPIALHVGDPESFMAPPYVANLVVVGQSCSETLADRRLLERIYESVRPYGGKLWVDAARAMEQVVTEMELPADKTDVPLSDTARTLV